MRRFWLFRSNLKSLEYYHQYTNLSQFIKNCHDYYLLFPLWLLQKGYYDEVTIWRLSDRIKSPIVFDVDGKKFYQRWDVDFTHTMQYPQPDISFFRGGFKEYDTATRIAPKKFGKKIYLGAGQRINAQWGGKYDIFLMEDDLDLKMNKGTIPFYKTASPFIFFPMNLDKTWDICWPCNFTQIKYKGQEFFIKKIAESRKLQKLKIVHCGNGPEVGRKLCMKYGVKNIDFVGQKNREELNNILNCSKFGLNLSNRHDGCPRVSTEILMSGTPLIVHENTRLLSYYKTLGVIEVNDKDITKKIISGLKQYEIYKDQVIKAINHNLSFDNINQKNIDLWTNQSV